MILIYTNFSKLNIFLVKFKFFLFQSIVLNSYFKIQNTKLQKEISIYRNFEVRFFI